jgi:hypothetical protein
VVEILIVLAIAAVTAVVGFRVGILVAPRLERRAHPEEADDDRSR